MENVNNLENTFVLKLTPTEATYRHSQGRPIARLKSSVGCLNPESFRKLG